MLDFHNTDLYFGPVSPQHWVYYLRRDPKDASIHFLFLLLSLVITHVRLTLSVELVGSGPRAITHHISCCQTIRQGPQPRPLNNGLICETQSWNMMCDLFGKWL